MLDHIKAGALILVLAFGVGCDDQAPAAGTTTTAKAAAPATQAPKATAAAPTQAPTQAPAAAKVVGIAADEMVASSCNSVPKDSECGEVVVKTEAEKAKVKDAMKQICKSGTVADTACAADKMVGTCRVGKDMINHYYADGPKSYTAETAKKACEKNMGRWVNP